MKKNHEAEKKLVALTTELQRSRENYEQQRALNAELSQKLGVLEYRYQQVMIETKNKDATYNGGGGSPNWSPSKRIYEV
jgi:hypothetical protein